MLWLTKEKGHTVIGVEGVESVVKEFFAENSIECDRSELDGGIGAKFVASTQKRAQCYSSAEARERDELSPIEVLEYITFLRRARMAP